MGLWDDFTDAVSDAGNAVVSVVEGVGDAVEGAGHAIANAVRDIENGFGWVPRGLGWVNEWVCTHGGSAACRIGNIVLGGLGGVFKGIGDLVGKVADIFDHLGGFLGAVLRFDFADALAQLGLIVWDVVELYVDVVRFLALGTIFGGIVDAWNAENLRRFVVQLLSETFGDDPPRLERIRQHLGLDGTGWGLPLQATHRVFRLDSANVPLFQWHRDGTIDLFAMAHVLSFDSFPIGRRRTTVRVVSQEGTVFSSIPATRLSIANYLESEGKDVRLQVFALNNKAITELTQVATRKHARIGIKLSWNVDGLGALDVPPAHDITTPDEFTIDQEAFGTYLGDRGYRQGTREEQCEALAFTAFFMKAKLGNTVGRNIDDGANVAPCPPGRDDHCCNTVIVASTPNQRVRGSGCIYHDQYPTGIFRYVLAHELGHYVGLCHYGHGGFQNIMFTPNPKAGLSYTSWGLSKFYLHNEPELTLDDGKNAWRFVVGEMPRCLEPPPVP
jgi:hypothetical protein